MVLIWLGPVFQIQAQKEWEGYFAGLEVSRHYMFGQARVNSHRIVGEGTSWAVGANIGHQWHSEKDMVFGIEVQLNQPFADLKNDSNSQNATVNYSLRQQTAFQLQLGKAFGKVNQNLPLAYFSVTQTRVDIDVRQQQSTTTLQSREENFFRYGLGFHTKLFENVSARILAGTSFDLISNTDNGFDLKVTFMGSF